MSKVKSYILCPNFSFQPDGPIRLGNIIADPSKPTKPIIKFDDSKAKPETVTTPETKHIINSDHGRSLHGGVWARFLEFAGVSAGVKLSSDVLTQYVMDMDVTYFKEEPTDAEAAEIVKDKKVQAVMKSGIFGSEPVFMITGLRIAKGFRVMSQVLSGQEGKIDGSVQSAGGFSVGGQGGSGQRVAGQESFRSGKDIIFAYQLHIISEKGWKEKRIEIDVHTPKAAYLHNSTEEMERNNDIVINPASEADLVEAFADIDGISVHTVEAKDGNEACTCIYIRK